MPLSLLRILITVLLLAAGCATTRPERPAGPAPWPGKYVQYNGTHDLYIKSEKPTGWIYVVIVDAGHDKNDRANSSYFLAEIKGELASMFTLHDDPNCKVDLRRTLEGIIIDDRCDGEGEAGLYRPVEAGG